MSRRMHRRLGAVRGSAAVLGAVWLAACAAQADRFYTLSVLPAGPAAAAAQIRTQVVLSVSVPSIDERRELVVHAGGDRILVLEHERWAAPLADLATQTLARDIERRRADVLVAGRGFDRSDPKALRMTVELARLSLEPGGRVTLEAHWRIVDPAADTDLVGADSFEVPAAAAGDEYAAAARALSECLAALADRLVGTFPAR